MTITVDDTVYEILRPFVEGQTIGELLSDFARSRLAKPAYTESELEAGYCAMAADAEREAEAQEWCNALIGDMEYEKTGSRYPLAFGFIFQPCFP